MFIFYLFVFFTSNIFCMDDQEGSPKSLNSVSLGNYSAIEPEEQRAQRKTTVDEKEAPKQDTRRNSPTADLFNEPKQMTYGDFYYLINKDDLTELKTHQNIWAGGLGVFILAIFFLQLKQLNYI